MDGWGGRQATLGLGLPEAGPKAADDDLGGLVDAAAGVLERLLEDDVVVVAWSSGKDSTACLILALVALERLRARGGAPAGPLYVQHGDTMVESPAITALASDMVGRLEAWAEERGHDVRVRVSRPALAENWVVSVLGGRALPTYASSRRRHCSVDMKIAPSARTARGIAAEVAALPCGPRRLVTVIGTRYDESASRSANMAKRGESAAEVRDHDGRHLLAPIAHWGQDSVWELLGTAGTGMGEYPVWRDSFAATIETYREALGGECPVVAAAGKLGRTGCGARFGCVTCVAVKTDRSLRATAEGARSAHLRRLLRNRDFLAAIQGDYGRRAWVTRQVREAGGRLQAKVQPDGFDSRTLLDLAGAYILADREEHERAGAFARAVRLGRVPDDEYVRGRLEAGLGMDDEYAARMGRPQFRLVDDRQLVAADFYNAVLRRHPRPMELLELHHRIWEEGHSPELPDPGAHPPRPAPAARWVDLGPAGEAFPGLAEPLAAAFAGEQCFGGADLHGSGAGTYVANASGSFDVDPEAASLMVGLLYPTHWRSSMRGGREPTTSAVTAYLALGAVSLSPQGRHAMHRIMQVRQRIERLGLYDMPTDGLLAMSWPDDGSPGAAQEALAL